MRYSTTGSNAWENTQPVWRSDRREIALAHNGNLINAVELHAELREKGVSFSSTSDSEIIAALIATHPAETIQEAIADVMPRLRGAFSTVVMTNNKVVAFRDPAGLRPLVLGQLGDRYCVASESCAFDIVGAKLMRDVLPGEMVSLGEHGIQTRQIVEGRVRRSASSSTSTSRAPTRAWAARCCRSPARGWARCCGTRRRVERRPGDRGARLGQRRGPRACARAAGCPRTTAS